MMDVAGMKFSLMYKIGFALNVNFWHYNDPKAFGRSSSAFLKNMPNKVKKTLQNVFAIQTTNLIFFLSIK